MGKEFIFVILLKYSAGIKNRSHELEPQHTGRLPTFGKDLVFSLWEPSRSRCEKFN